MKKCSFCVSVVLNGFTEDKYIDSPLMCYVKYLKDKYRMRA